MSNPNINALLRQCFEDIPGVLTVLIYDRKDYSLLSYFDNPDLNDTQINTNHNLITHYFEEIDNEYGKENDFLIISERDNTKLVFCSTDSFSMILTIAEKGASEIDLKIYSIHVAGEIEELKNLGSEKSEEFELKTPSIIKIYSKVKKIKPLTQILLMKIIVVGDYKAGKTSLINRFTDKIFSNDLNSTSAFKVIKKVLNIDDKTIMNLAIWDTGGLSSQISPSKEKIYKFADAALIVLDISNRNPPHNIEKWYNEIVESVSYEIPILLAITKVDLSSVDLNSRLKDIEETAKNLHITHLLVSAKTGENIDDLFYEIIYTTISSKTKGETYELTEDSHKYKDYYVGKSERDALKDLEQFI